MARSARYLPPAAIPAATTHASTSRHARASASPCPAPSTSSSRFGPASAVHAPRVLGPRLRVLRAVDDQHGDVRCARTRGETSPS
jgi:hypothetical protein